MPRSSQSFRLLLYLEWLLLSIAIVSAVLPVPFHPVPHFSILKIVCTVGLGLMGLRLPTRQGSKILYTLLEFALLLLPMVLDNQSRGFPFLIVIVVIRSSQMFELIGQAIVICLSFATFLLAVLQESKALEQILNSVRSTEAAASLPSSDTILLLKFHAGLSFGLMLLAIMLLVNTLLAERQSRTKLAIAHEQLRQYAARVEDQATLQERNRIAREIHDALGHALTAQSIQLENALLFCPAEAEKTQMFLVQSKQLCSKALQEVRQSVATLRSRSPQGQTLGQTITTAIQEFQQITDVQLDHSIDVSAIVPTEISAVVCRIVQEALVNIYKHSSATWVKLQLRVVNQRLVILVVDNGLGFDPNLNKTGFGLQGMRERTAALGGQFSLVSQPGDGCHITVSIPLPG